MPLHDARLSLLLLPFPALVFVLFGIGQGFADEIKPGDTVAVARDYTELKQGPADVAELGRGTKFVVTEIRGRWLGGHVELAGKKQSGWLPRESVYLPRKASQPPQSPPFYVYSDANAKNNHYFLTGWMGDYADLTCDPAWKKDPHSGATCIKFTYLSDRSQGAGWVGAYWQDPPNNWGNKPGGFNLSKCTKLVFWAKGEIGGERLGEVKVGGITGEYADTAVAGIGPIKLTNKWKQYTIDLRGKDFSTVIGGFAWATSLDSNPDGMVFYLDDIRFE
jgi:hypothetical protein